MVICVICTIIYMTLHALCHPQEETTCRLTLQYLHCRCIWIVYPSLHHPLLAHRTHLANWHIVFCTTSWSRPVLQRTSHLACQVPCRSISRPWDSAGKHILICEGKGWQARMRGLANFSRSLAEFMAGWFPADISYDKGDRMLEVLTNIRFNELQPWAFS